MGNIDPRGAFVIKGDSTRPPRDRVIASLMEQRHDLEGRYEALHQQLKGAVEAARADMAEHLRKLSLDPSWKYEVRVAFEYAARTFDDPDSGGR